MGCYGKRSSFSAEKHGGLSLLVQVYCRGLFECVEYSNEYIEKANGMTIAADKERIFIIKAGSRSWYYPDKTILESGDIIFVDRIPLQDARSGLQNQINIETLKNRRVQLIMSGVGALTSIITAYVAVRRLN